MTRKQLKDKEAADMSTIIRQIFMNNYKAKILMHPKKFYYPDQETPMHIAVISVVHLVSSLD